MVLLEAVHLNGTVKSLSSPFFKQVILLLFCLNDDLQVELSMKRGVCAAVQRFVSFV